MRKFSAPPNLDEPGCSRSPSPLPGTAASSGSCGCRGGDDCGCPRCSHKRTNAPVYHNDVPNVVIHQLAPVEKSCEPAKTETPTEEKTTYPAPCFDLTGATTVETGSLWVAERLDPVKQEWCLRPWNPQVTGTNPLNNPACGLVHLENGIPRVISYEDVKVDSNGNQNATYAYLYAQDGCNSHVVAPKEGETPIGCNGKWELRPMPNRMLRVQRLIRDIAIIDTATTSPMTSGSYDLKSLFTTGATGDAEICSYFESNCVVGAWVEACVQTAGNQKLEFRVGTTDDYMTLCVASSNDGYTYFKLDEEQPETPEFIGRGEYNFDQVSGIWKIDSIVYLDDRNVDFSNIPSTVDTLEELVTALNEHANNPDSWTWVADGAVLQLQAPVSHYINYILINDKAYVIDEAPEEPEPVGEDVAYAPSCACSTEYVGLTGGRHLKWELLNPGDASLTEDDQVKIVLRLKGLDLDPCC